MGLELNVPQLFHDLTAYLAEHPMVLGGIGLFAILAIVGAWYVVSHHLHVLLVSTLCIAGLASGLLVLYRGYQLGMRDLILVGLFLLVIFPVIYLQLIKVAKIAYGDKTANAAMMSKGMAKRAGA